MPLIDTVEPSPSAAFDMRELRDCFGAFYTGVTVVTTTRRERDASTVRPSIPSALCRWIRP